MARYEWDIMAGGYTIKDLKPDEREAVTLGRIAMWHLFQSQARRAVAEIESGAEVIRRRREEEEQLKAAQQKKAARFFNKRKTPKLPVGGYGLPQNKAELRGLTLAEWYRLVARDGAQAPFLHSRNLYPARAAAMGPEKLAQWLGIGDTPAQQIIDRLAAVESAPW